MPTKAELQTRVEGLEHDVRRLKRALAQADLDVHELPPKMVYWPTPHTDNRSIEAVERGLAEWRENVVDPSPRIDTYIRTQKGLGWSWEKQYKKNGQFAWCGAFASFCWSSVKLDIRKNTFPSCYRMNRDWGHTSRRIDTELMQTGDIVVVYSAARKSYGDHITLCVEPLDGSDTFETVEGNAHGQLGDGTRGEGVIIRRRSLDEVAHVYRLLGGDFDE